MGMGREGGNRRLELSVSFKPGDCKAELLSGEVAAHVDP